MIGQKAIKNITRGCSGIVAGKTGHGVNKRVTGHERALCRHGPNINTNGVHRFSSPV